jgi:rhamnulose-1-phosphate aldolase
MTQERNMMSSIVQSWFIKAMVKATGDMWLKGWDERNGGNVSLRLLDSDLEPYVAMLHHGRTLPIGEKINGLGGQCFLVTGSGKYLRNVQLDPEENLGVVRVAEDEESIQSIWGLRGDGVPTSELSAHLKSHRARQQVTGGTNRVIMHCHATNLIAITYVLDLSPAVITRALWEMSTECLVVFPEGVGVLPWMVPGTGTIGAATAESMRLHPLTLWPFHGVFGSGATLDEAFGLIDTAEKAAEILVKVLSMGRVKHTIQTQELLALTERFQVKPMREAMELESWCGTQD